MDSPDETLASIAGAWDESSAPLPWRIDRLSIHKHWTNSVSIIDAQGGEVCVFTRGYESDANGDGRPSWRNATLICHIANSFIGFERSI